jgi:hypothetical protein
VNSDGARVFIKRTFGASCAYLCVGVRMDMRSESSGVDVRLQPPLACFLSPPRIHTFFFFLLRLLFVLPHYVTTVFMRL